MSTRRPAPHDSPLQRVRPLRRRAGLRGRSRASCEQGTDDVIAGVELGPQILDLALEPVNLALQTLLLGLGETPLQLVVLGLEQGTFDGERVLGAQWRIGDGRLRSPALTNGAPAARSPWTTWSPPG